MRSNYMHPMVRNLKSKRKLKTKLKKSKLTRKLLPSRIKKFRTKTELLARFMFLRTQLQEKEASMIARKPL